jgi:hypothetical protein
MRIYTGLDLSRTRLDWHACAVDGTPVDVGAVPPDPDGFARLVHRLVDAEVNCWQPTKQLVVLSAQLPGGAEVIADGMLTLPEVSTARTTYTAPAGSSDGGRSYLRAVRLRSAKRRTLLRNSSAACGVRKLARRPDLPLLQRDRIYAPHTRPRRGARRSLDV